MREKAAAHTSLLRKSLHQGLPGGLACCRPLLSSALRKTFSRPFPSSAALSNTVFHKALWCTYVYRRSPEQKQDNFWFFPVIGDTHGKTELTNTQWTLLQFPFLSLCQLPNMIPSQLPSQWALAHSGLHWRLGRTNDKANKKQLNLLSLLKIFHTQKNRGTAMVLGSERSWPQLTYCLQSPLGLPLLLGTSHPGTSGAPTAQNTVPSCLCPCLLKGCQPGEKTRPSPLLCLFLTPVGFLKDTW